MHGSPPHITLELALEAPARGPMHHTRIIPDDEVALAFPSNADDVPLARGMRAQHPEQSLRLGGRQALDVVHVAGKVQVHATARFVRLHEAVSAHEALLGVHVAQELGRRRLARVRQRVRGHVVVAQ